MNKSRRTTSPCTLGMRTRCITGTLSALVVVLVGVLLPLPHAAAFGEPCAPVMLYFSRGSGEADGLGTAGGALLQQLKRTTQTSVQGAANPYPAVAVGSPTEFYNAIIGSSAYLHSVEFGAQFLAHDVTDIATRCTTSKIVVGGYSQGAEATRYGLSRLTPAVQAHIQAVTLFGDPWFLPNEANVIATGGFDRTLKGIHYTKSFSYPILPTALPIGFKGRSVSWCHLGDLVCQFSAGNVAGGFGPHLNYGNDAPAAAETITPLLGLTSAGGGGSTGGTSGGRSSICETFVADVTIPDGTLLSPGQGFTKTWSLLNCGASAWVAGQAVRVSGNFGPASFAVPAASPGATVDVSVPLKAPTVAGHYSATYRLKSPTGTLGNNIFWVDINVAGGGRDCEAFVADVSIPDGTVVSAAQTLNKVWTLQNCGTTDWTGLVAVRTAGTFGPTSFAVPTVAPGAMADITVPMVAPAVAGSARSTYRLQAPDGHFADNSFWVEVNVTTIPHDCEAFVADLTVPDGTTLAPNQLVTKSWRLANCGTTDWTRLTAVRTDGAFGPTSFAVAPVAPGATEDVSASFVAPAGVGHYRATYRLQAADGHFGDNSFWIDINVGLPAYPYTIVNTGGAGLNARSGPSTGFAVTRSIPAGATVLLVCQAHGQRVVSETDIWDQTSSGDWVYDEYVSTTNIGAFSPPLAIC